MKILAIFTSLILLSPFSQAFEVSTQERERYLQRSEMINEHAAACLQDIWDEHTEFHNRWKVSKFYGDRNTSLNTPAKRRQALIDAGAPAHLEKELEATSCIGLARRCLQEGFAAAGDPMLTQVWNRLDAWVRANGVSGVFLINGLQKLGWRVLFWNPDPSQNATWDKEDPQNLPGKPASWNTGVKNSKGQYIYNSGWGMHQMRYNDVMRTGKYYQTRVDDRSTLVNFKQQVPEAFTRSPLFVGVAHSGYHVFPGYSGTVIEAHSTRPLKSVDNLEHSFFNPLAPRGGPRWSKTEKYRSGIVALPPGY